MILGTTYSKRHIEWLGLDHKEAFNELLDLNFDLIRLGTYWSEIQEKSSNEFDFSKIKYMLDLCEMKNQDVLLTIGVKAPRWPEYYFPEWLKDKNTTNLIDNIKPYLEKVIKELKSYKCIKYWQVENEPLDPSGEEEKSIPIDVLSQEIEIVRKLDKTKIVCNLWGNNLSEREFFPLAEGIADIVGLDIYYRVPNIFGYSGPKDSDKELKKIINKSSTDVWINELQAEPWERKAENNFTSKQKSINPEIILKNYERVKKLGVKAILFWGFEYWYLRKIHSDEAYMDIIKKIIDREKLN